MSDKKPISLVISDIDSTIADKYDTWAFAVDEALDRICALYGRDRKDVVKDLLDFVPEDQRHIAPYIGKDLAADIARTPSLRPQTPAQEKEMAKILHDWSKKRHQAKLYDGAAQTINKIRQSGAKFVLYTDSRESQVLPRLAKMGITADMIDALYAMPDTSKGKVIHKEIKGEAYKLREGLGDRMILLEPGAQKPNPAVMQRIINDMGISDNASVVMVGDNVRADGTGAVTIGANYAWQKGGTDLSPTTIRCYEELNQEKEYKLTADEHYKQMNDSNRPTVILSQFMDLPKHFVFMSEEKLKALQTQKAKEEPKKTEQKTVSSQAVVNRALMNRGR